MIISLQTNGENYQIDLAQPFDISIPLNFDGEQPNAFGVERASSKACEAGDLVGDTRRGGSCNFEQVKFIPHCNGTHTESIGHITRERISIHDCLKDAFIPAILLSIEPENAGETNETYAVELSENDELITRKAIENTLENGKWKTENGKLDGKKDSDKFLEGLIIRTLPNDESKLTRTYLDEIPPFFSIEAMRFIAEKDVKHLLVDLPSIDRIYDEGKLTNHRIFWNVEQGTFAAETESLINNTITELIFVPDEIADGKYLLNLQIAPFASDAAPSRPVLFRLV
jgi:kynurenine formamidase